MPGEDVFIGVLYVELRIPHARSRKDRRSVTRALKDRVRARFSVSFSEVDAGDQPRRAALALTVSGNARQPLRDLLGRVRTLVEQTPTWVPVHWDTEVFRWTPELSRPERWAALLSGEE